MADHVDAAAAGSPHQLRELAGGQVREVGAVELRERGDDDSARGHVDAERQRLRREDDLDEPALEQLFDHLLVVREQARMMLGKATAQEPGVDHPAKQRFFVVVGETLQSLGRDHVDCLLLRPRS